MSFFMTGKCSVGVWQIFNIAFFKIFLFIFQLIRQLKDNLFHKHSVLCTHLTVDYLVLRHPSLSFLSWPLFCMKQSIDIFLFFLQLEQSVFIYFFLESVWYSWKWKNWSDLGWIFWEIYMSTPDFLRERIVP